MGKKVLIIGAGPGGLVAGMLLASQGFQVEVLEKENQVGGRNGRLTLGDNYHFETGPTFLMLPSILEEIFEETGRKLSEYLELKRIDPLYRLIFPNGKSFQPTADADQMKQQMDELFPGDYSGYERFRKDEEKKFNALYPCLQTPYGRLTDYLSPRFLKALPYLDAFRSIYSRLADCFEHEEMRLAMTFQAKYLGMSPWHCPATFAMIPFIEHQFGVWHPTGGLNQISSAMAERISELGGQIRLNAEVRKICVQNGKAQGVELLNSEMIQADYIVMNTDFAYGMTHLLKEEEHPSWSSKKIAKSEYSCSTFMIYLGLDKQYEIPHHNVIFAEDYKSNIDGISHGEALGKDFSFYVQNPWVTDLTLAPEGHSTLYILVPAPNLENGFDWETVKAEMREIILDKVQDKLGIEDIRSHIQVEKIITPEEWLTKHYVFNGAVFNLAHTINQMLYFRPHNEYDDVDGLYLVGGGTHPGSGLPTIYESGRISAKLIKEKSDLYQ